MGEEKSVCPVCPHACALTEGKIGLCRARVARGGQVVPVAYGAYSALALDPIEKKPFCHFYPGHTLLSIGGYGCNMRCYFCQNADISQCETPGAAPRTTPETLIEYALALREDGCIGLAFTYNEPGIHVEFVLDTAKLARAAGLKTAMVTNGYLNEAPWRALAGQVDAYNIDLKCFHEEGYRKLGGDLDVLLRNISIAVESAHVEITTLIVPGLSDSLQDMDRQARWLAGLSPALPLHITRYFPRHRAEAPPTPLELLHDLAGVARRHLQHVYIGNC